MGAALIVLTTAVSVRHPATAGSWAPHAEGPPPGHTGGFNEPTCQECHSEFPLKRDEESLRVTGFPDRFTPGEQYVVEISLLGDDMVMAGFQASIRFAEGDSTGGTAGLITPVDANVTVKQHPESGIHYVQHTREGAGIVSSGAVHWSFVWTAAGVSDRVQLNVAANDANGDNSPLGDFVYAMVLSAEGSGSPSRSR